MVKVENKETLRLVARRFMKMNRARNTIAILSIILTALLFSSLFMGAQSLLLSRQATENEQSMCSSHAILQDMESGKDKQILAALNEDSGIARFGTGRFLGSGISDKFAFSVELRYGDENLAESFNCRPQFGNMPKAYGEIALSSLILDAWGMPHKLGQKVSLEWEVFPGQTKTDQFTVCGYWEGDKAVMSQLAWVSEPYADKNAYRPAAEEIENGVYNGSLDYCVWFKNIWKLAEKTKQLSQNAGFQGEKGFQANTSYDLTYEDSFSFGPVAAFAIFILLAGFLILYNIFSISVKTDIRAYGLLKNVGTTGKQLNQIVHMQALAMSVAGIPIGLLLGYAAGFVMARTLAGSDIDAQVGQAAQVVVAANPWMFLLAGFLTLLTVYLSCWPACRMVKKLSPVEALRLADSQASRRKVKKHTSATWLGMAVQNVLRNWKKGCIVMASIAFSLVVANCIVIIVQGYDFDAYKKIHLEADFQLDKLNSMPNVSDTNAVTPEIRKLLEAYPGSKELGYISYTEGKYAIDSKLQDALQADADGSKDTWNEWQKEIWARIQEEKKVDVQLFGISKMVFDKLEWEGEPLRWEDFNTGNYAIVYYTESTTYAPVYFCPAGDAFRYEYGNGKVKEYQSFGKAELPYALDYPFAYMMELKVLLPEGEYQKHTGNKNAMRALVNVEKGGQSALKEYLESTVMEADGLFNIFSVLDLEETFGRYVDRYYLIGGTLALILAFIGIMNFTNTMAASVFSRKRELTLLEAVGMTKRQITKMLVAEGCIYLLGALLLAATIVWFGAEAILAHTVGLSWFFHIHVTVLPCMCLLPILVLIAVAIPYSQYRKMARESVVDRIRI